MIYIFKSNSDMFGSNIKQLLKELQLPQRVVASASELNTPMHIRIEFGRRTDKRAQISINANVSLTEFLLTKLNPKGHILNIQILNYR